MVMSNTVEKIHFVYKQLKVLFICWLLKCNIYDLFQTAAFNQYEMFLLFYPYIYMQIDIHKFIFHYYSTNCYCNHIVYKRIDRPT